jgi:hypothetical protein
MNKFVALSSALLLGCLLARADVAKLKNGDTLNGAYRGGTATTVSFEVYGNVMQLPTSDVVSVAFAAPAAAPAPVPPPPPPAPVAGPVTLPAGTLLLVRMIDTVSSKSSAGANFTTKLEYDLVIDGVRAVKAGTIIYGKVQSATQARRAIGKSTLDIRLAQIVINGSPVPIVSSGYAEAGDASIKKVAKAAAVGAVIGNNTGDGDGGEGALIGAGVSMLKPGQTLTIAPGTLIEFTLSQGVTVQVGR